MSNEVKYRRQYAYRERNKESIYRKHLELQKKLYKKNPSKFLKYAREYYQKNKEKVQKRIHLYSLLQTTKAKRAGWNAVRRKRLGKPNKEFFKHIEKLIEETNFCSLCGIQMFEYGTYPNGKTIDHIKPLCVGGDNVVGNIRVTCFKCNISRPKR